ncbi:MAG TPA: PilZ domain-containing protein [Acidobacteriota bacterium]
MASELRRQKRLHLDLPINVRLLDEVKGVPSESEGKLHDLSAGGCAFFHINEIPVASRIQVKIELNEALQKRFRKKELTARGAIIRIEKHPSGFLLSVRFFK